MLCLNSHYRVLFKDARDASQVANLARQMYPGKSTFMIEAFKYATSAPYGYLLIDLKQETDDKLGLGLAFSWCTSEGNNRSIRSCQLFI